MTRKLPRWARDVRQQHREWTVANKASTAALEDDKNLAKPIAFVIEPTGSSETFHPLNHCPSITWLPNGDLIAIWFSTQLEVGTEMTILASRLRAGKNQWDASSEFFKSPNHNMTGSSLFHDGHGTIYHFNSMGPKHVTGWDNLAFLMRTSVDNGVTWTLPRAIDPRFRYRNQVISGTLLTKQGVLIQACDADPDGSGGTALKISFDKGLNWTDPGQGKTKPKFANGGSGEGTIAGIHAKVVELSDGRLMAFGRGDTINGKMPKSISSDMGKTWKYSASPFPQIGGGQRLVLTRLNEGPLLLVSFTHHNRFKPEARGMRFTNADGHQMTGYGMFAAVSLDEGETWPIRKLLTPGEGIHDGGAWTQEFTASPTRAEHAGYLAVTQTPDNVIHLISSRLHYRFDLDWLRTDRSEF